MFGFVQAILTGLRFVILFVNGLDRMPCDRQNRKGADDFYPVVCVRLKMGINCHLEMNWFFTSVSSNMASSEAFRRGFLVDISLDY